MLRTLARSDVTEFAVVSDRLPCVKVNGKFDPIDDTAPSTDAILEMLVSAGGSRYVDRLGARPSQWTTRVDGLGMIGVTALLRDGVVQARFSLMKREERAVAPPPAADNKGAGNDDARSLGRADIDPRARSRNTNFCTFPDGVRGSSVTISSRSGQYCLAT